MLSKLTYPALTLTFLALVYFSPTYRPGPFEFVLLALATFRLGRLVAFDKVFALYRSPFVQTVISDRGETTEPRGSGPRRVIGELLSCPICSGTWVALLLVIGLNSPLQEFTRVFVLVMATAGSIEVFHALTEAFQWTGEAERKEAQ